ncbi:MAG: 16S rRNA (guanine(966)-N(2))-methyltransferase RsmD [Desulfobacterales bacterium]|nr:16S rRNA (guanine(966)-N(2))-methyltransferase RsmD [Desulfobacterales bacterium]
MIKRVIRKDNALRIISGKLRGKKLLRIRGMDIRPTSDQVRESIFNIISSQVRGTSVLDLFAGTGALGIEALSRGAESAVFIDNNKISLSVIEKNIKSCNFEDKTKIIKWNIATSLNCIKSAQPPFNLVFMDPPYRENLAESALHNLHKSRSLENGACIIVEHPFQNNATSHFSLLTSHFPLLTSHFPLLTSHFSLLTQRKYGKTLVSFLSYML